MGTRQIICKLHLSHGIIARGKYEYTNTVEIASVLLPLDAIYIAVRRISGNNRVQSFIFSRSSFAIIIRNEYNFPRRNTGIATLMYTYVTFPPDNNTLQILDSDLLTKVRGRFNFLSVHEAKVGKFARPIFVERRASRATST